MEVVDADGRHVGTVADLWPDDGGGLPELMLVAVGRRFRRLHYLPLQAARAHDGALRVPWTRWAIEDAPSADDRRWGDPAHVALAHWRRETD